MAAPLLSPSEVELVDNGHCALCGSPTDQRCSRCAVALCGRCGTSLNLASWADTAELHLCRICRLAMGRIR